MAEENYVQNFAQAQTEIEELYEETEELQDQLSAQLESEQILYQADQQIAQIYEQGHSYGHPSYFKYGVLYALAIPRDILDFVGWTGLGLLISKPIGWGLSGLIFWISWMTNTKVKRAQEYTDGLEETINKIRGNIAHATRMTMRTAKIAGIVGKHTKIGRTIARQVPRRLVKIRKWARKNPLTKILVGAIGDAIPFLDSLPWSTISVYLSYRDEKTTYLNAGLAADDAREQLAIAEAEAV